MLSDSFQTTILLFLIFISVILLGGFVIFFRRLFHLEESFRRKEEKIIKDYQSILLKARRNAQGILAEAEGKKEIRDEKTDEEEQIAINITKEKAAVSLAGLGSKYDKDTQLLETEILQETQKLFAELSQTTKKSVDMYLENFAKQTMTVDTSLREKVDIAFKQVEEEISLYKKAQLEEVTQTANALVMKLTQDVLGRTITPTEHKQLILDALEKAKKEQILLNGTR